MVFSSLVFLCIFLPAVFCLHTLIPSIRVRNALLILASLLFYAYGEPVYVLLMIASAFLNYLYALLMEKATNKKPILLLMVITNVGILGVFKYAGFFVTTLNSLFRLSLPVPQIALPIGISFFTFQAMSYVLDVYYEMAKCQKSFFKVLLYISFFPQLIAGPIVKYRDIESEIEERIISLPEAAVGFRRFVYGLGKKVLIANTMAYVADNIFNRGAASSNILIAWLGAAAYTLQVYFDFSGYSDMAIGMGRMFGFHFQENFLFPYASRSISEFWGKWHISLTTFFRNYLFFVPLFGKRRKYGNFFLVWFLSGLWHGANWTFVVWGLYHACFLMLEIKVPKMKRLPKVAGHIYTMLVVLVGEVIFRAPSLSEAGRFIGKMFTGFDFSATYMSFALQQLTPYFLVMFAAAVFFCGPIQNFALGARREALNFQTWTRKERVRQVSLYVVAVVLLLWCIIRLSGGAYNPFIYFQF